MKKIWNALKKLGKFFSQDQKIRILKEIFKTIAKS